MAPARVCDVPGDQGTLSVYAILCTSYIATATAFKTEWPPVHFILFPRKAWGELTAARGDPRSLTDRDDLNRKCRPCRLAGGPVGPNPPIPVPRWRSAAFLVAAGRPIAHRDVTEVLGGFARCRAVAALPRAPEGRGACRALSPPGRPSQSSRAMGQAVQNLAGLLDEYEPRRDNLPESLTESSTAQRVEALLQLRDPVRRRRLGRSGNDLLFAAGVAARVGHRLPFLLTACLT
jgi:hypothetical protein